MPAGPGGSQDGKPEHPGSILTGLHSWPQLFSDCSGKVVRPNVGPEAEREAWYYVSAKILLPRLVLGLTQGYAVS